MCKQVFEEMLCEAIENYGAIFEIIPLEQMNPAVFVKYMPPCHSIEILERPFWRQVSKLVSQDTFVRLFKEDSLRIYEKLSVEYCYDLDMPGKALVILRDALQGKLVSANSDSSINLPAIAMESAERVLFKQKIRTSSLAKNTPKNLPEDRKERVKQFFDLSDNISGAIDYFKETMWIFTLNKRLYERYLNELRWFLQTKEVSFVFDLAQAHGDPELVTLKDQDIVQILLDTIYLRVKVDSEEIDRIRGLVLAADQSSLANTNTTGNLGNLTQSTA